MSETLWGPAIAVFGSGLAAGAVLAMVLYVRARRRRAAVGGLSAGAAGVTAHLREDAGDPARSPGDAADVPAEIERVADLRSRKAQLLEQLRDLQDTASATEEERADLERQAAQVMRALDESERMTVPSTAARAAAPAPVSLRSWPLKAALAVAVLGLTALALWQGVRPRAEGMGITGGDFAGSSGASSSGSAGAMRDHPTDTEAGPIVARQTPRLRAAKAALEADPASLEARIELGYALAEAGGWIDVHKNAEVILARDPGNADGLIQAAMLRFAMRQPAQADALIDEVLAREPDNVRALEVGGRLSLAVDNWGRAVGLLERAVAQSGPQSALEPLLQRARLAARRGGQPGRGETPPVDRPAASAGKLAQASRGGSSAAGVSGTITLADGVRSPRSGVLFVMARPAGVTAGPPAAARRLPNDTFPVAFRLDQSNAMMGGELPGNLALSARLDADGNVATRQPEDLVGAAEGSVALGATGVEIVLRPAPESE